MFDFHLENTPLARLFQAKYLHRIVTVGQGGKIPMNGWPMNREPLFYCMIFLKKLAKKQQADWGMLGGIF